MTRYTIIIEKGKENYQGGVMPAWQFASIGTFSQMNKAIPLLLEMRDDIKEMTGDIKEVRKNTDTIPQALAGAMLAIAFWPESILLNISTYLSG